MRALLLGCLLAAAAGGEEPALPSWLKLGAEIRGRGEAVTGQGFVPGNDDGYYLHRLRLNASIEPLPWLKLFLQAQDSQAPGYNHPVPSTVADTLDLRQGYVEASGGRWRLRAGRQEIIFGEERLVGASNWGNVSRSFDALRLTWKRSRAQLDWFAAAVVVPVNGRFDRPHFDNKLYGFYSSFKDWNGQGGVLEPYFLWKSQPVGNVDVYTWGARATGALPVRFDYGLEMALQRGHATGQAVRAWAGHWVLGYTLPLARKPPRLAAEYNHASGDSDPRDRRRGTFDQLYPTNHNKYGTADRIGWRNIHDLMAGLEWKPGPKWKWNLDYHNFWLATRQDALYTEAGAAFIRNPLATSSRIGSEIDLQAGWQYSERLQFALGCAHLFAGPFLKQSGRASGVTYPYLMWSYRL